MKKTIIIDIISVLFFILFVYASVSKVTDVQKFRIQLGQSPMLTAFAGIVSITIPAIELIIAGMLAFSKTRLYGLYASFTLMVMFTAYIVAITQFSEFVPCSCGGILQRMGWTEHLIFNIGFVVLGIVGVFMEHSHLETQQHEDLTTNDIVVQ